MKNTNKNKSGRSTARSGAGSRGGDSSRSTRGSRSQQDFNDVGSDVGSENYQGQDYQSQSRGRMYSSDYSNMEDRDYRDDYSNQYYGGGFGGGGAGTREGTWASSGRNPRSDSDYNEGSHDYSTGSRRSSGSNYGSGYGSENDRDQNGNDRSWQDRSSIGSHITESGYRTDMSGTGLRGRGSFSSGSDWSSEQPGGFAGKGPKGYKRSDDRIREDLCERLSHHHAIDASEIEVNVKDGEITFTGTVSNRQQRRLAEEIAEQVVGMGEIHNELTIAKNADSSSSANTNVSSANKKGTNTSATAAVNRSSRTS